MRPGPTDIVPAMLTPGEVVLTDQQQNMIGKQKINKVLSATGGFQNGGYVPGTMGERDDLLKDTENAFYGGGQAFPSPTPTPTPQPKSSKVPTIAEAFAQATQQTGDYKNMNNPVNYPPGFVRGGRIRPYMRPNMPRAMPQMQGFRGGGRVHSGPIPGGYRINPSDPSGYNFNFQPDLPPQSQWSDPSYEGFQPGDQPYGPPIPGWQNFPGYYASNPYLNPGSPSLPYTPSWYSPGGSPVYMDPYGFPYAIPAAATADPAITVGSASGLFHEDV